MITDEDVAAAIWSYRSKDSWTEECPSDDGMRAAAEVIARRERARIVKLLRKFAEESAEVDETSAAQALNDAADQIEWETKP